MTAVRSSLLAAGAAGIGATSMFLLDPARGARRRALVKDKVTRATRKTADVAGATWRDAGNRVEGLRARTRALFTRQTIDDAKLIERIRTALGRVTSHQRAISVSAHNGCVTLTGHALASEVSSIVSAVGRVPGVFGVETDLRTHASAERVPLLQGGSKRSGLRNSWLPSSWSPTAILAAGSAIVVAGAALAFNRQNILSSAGIAA